MAAKQRSTLLVQTLLLKMPKLHLLHLLLLLLEELLLHPCTSPTPDALLLLLLPEGVHCCYLERRHSKSRV
jgi:hypothetical protein